MSQSRMVPSPLAYAIALSESTNIEVADEGRPFSVNKCKMDCSETLYRSNSPLFRHSKLTYWVTIHNARDIYIRRRRVPLSEVYSSISENFHLAHTGGIEQSCVKVSTSVWYS